MIKVKHFMKENALYMVSQQSIPRMFYRLIFFLSGTQVKRISIINHSKRTMMVFMITFILNKNIFNMQEKCVREQKNLDLNWL